MTIFGAALANIRQAFIAVGIFSAAVNILMLTGPLFMLQVYDRVLTSKSIPTLIALFALVIVLYAFMSVFEFIRSRILSRAAYQFDTDLIPTVQKIWISQGIAAKGDDARPVHDLTMLRQFIAGRGPTAMFDLPWVPIYLAVVFILNVWLGLFALLGMMVLAALTAINEIATKTPLKESARFDASDAQLANQLHTNAEAVVSMGMVQRLSGQWRAIRKDAMSRSQNAGNVSEVISATTKGLRLAIQSGILALGAWLAIKQQITPGIMIAASIVAGRALSPVDQVIAQWKGFVRARFAYDRLKLVMEAKGTEARKVSLPLPKGFLSVNGATKLAVNDHGVRPENNKIILRALSFDLEPGDGLGVIGPSASGKSSLAKMLVGLWMPERGSVTLDGATYDLWDLDVLGNHIGYLPQNVELLPGSLRQNICRFDPSASDEDVIFAAKLAGVHEMILRLPGGYEAQMGGGDSVLSGGQAQRVALARAVYKMPALVVLDEPNANLDSDGDSALTSCITSLREAGTTVVVMAHRPSAITAVNKILMLHDGRQVQFGDKDQVLRQVTPLSVARNAG